MNHPETFRPEEHAVYNSEKMGKSTLFASDRILVGLNAFEPDQEHKLHAHEGMDKVYQVLEGEGVDVLLADDARALIQHSIRQGHDALVVASMRIHRGQIITRIAPESGIKRF